MTKPKPPKTKKLTVPKLNEINDTKAFSIARGVKSLEKGRVTVWDETAAARLRARFPLMPPKRNPPKRKKR